MDAVDLTNTGAGPVGIDYLKQPNLQQNVIQGKQFPYKLLSQMLMGAGAGVAGAKPGQEIAGMAKGLADVGMQQNASQNYMKMLKKILGGMPQGGKLGLTSNSPVGDSSGAINMSIPTNNVVDNTPQDSGGSSYPGSEKIDNSLQGNLKSLTNPSSSPLEVSPSPVGQTSGTDEVLTSLMKKFISGSEQTKSNPPDLSGITSEDLVGLSPESISRAFNILHVQRELNNRENEFKDKPLRDIMELIYKQKEMQNIDSQIKLRNTEHRGTADIQNYEYYKAHGGSKDFDKFRETDPTTFKEYQKNIESGGDPKGSYEDWMIKMKKAGAITIDQRVMNKQEMNKLEGESFFSDPKWANTLDSHMNSEESKQIIFDAGSAARMKAKALGIKDKDALNIADTNATELAKAKLKVSFIEDRVRAGGGQLAKDTVWDTDKKTLIWTIKWPSGTVQTLRYKVR
jgi:hypothetical protein